MLEKYDGLVVVAVLVGVASNFWKYGVGENPFTSIAYGIFMFLAMLFLFAFFLALGGEVPNEETEK